MLSSNEWEVMNKIILKIYSEEHSRSMRQSFLENLRALIDFDIAEFSLLDEQARLCDSVEVNMFSDEKIHIAETYNKYKEVYGSEITDYIFRYPESFIACGRTTLFRGDTFKRTKFQTLFLRSINMKYCCTLTVRANGDLIGEVSLYCSMDPDFSEKDIYILSQLKDHLAVKLSQLRDRNASRKLSKAQLDFLLEKNLTERETQIIELIFADVSNHEIAASLYISGNTLKKHVSNIYKKLNVSSRNQLRYVLSEISI
ncbi:LuxR family transcriptional regulator [Clostridiales bacterium]|nr:LuxR family transcriptional regulator [Clostridiales bacterium]